MSAEVWTHRYVEVRPWPRNDTALWDPFFDALADHYYADQWWRRFTPSIGAVGLVVSVGGLPWWMPGWWARRTVGNVAAASRWPCDVEYRVERTVMA